MKDLVSIIVPVYNVEKYLERCVTSLMNQSYKNIEILLIDDGSKDDSGKMCDNFAKNDSRIRVIHKQNEGLGLTRNVGIENAQGKYITFVDSDDYIDKDTILNSLLQIRKDRSDIVMYGLKRVSISNVIEEYQPNPSKTLYKNADVLNELLPDFINDNPNIKIVRNFTNSSCTCLYSTKLFMDNGVRFESERKIISEDTYMMFNLFPYIKSASIIKDCYYNYCENLSSLTHSYREDRFIALKHFYDESLKVFNKNNFSSTVRLRFNYLFLNYVFGNFKSIVMCNSLSFAKKYGEFKKIINDNLYRRIIKNIDIKKEPMKRKIFYRFVLLRQVLLCLLIVKLKYK